MTKEQMLQDSNKSSTWYSGMCIICNESFFTKVKTTKFCTKKCHYSRTGANNSNWKGGSRILRSDGYIMLTGYNNRPSTTKRGHIMEHRLTMERHLGRSLKPHESVHHKNGIRNDNRICNLELWTSPQRYGQRVEDLIDFVIEHYPDEVKSRLVTG